MIAEYEQTERAGLTGSGQHIHLCIKSRLRVIILGMNRFRHAMFVDIVPEEDGCCQPRPFLSHSPHPREHRLAAWTMSTSVTNEDEAIPDLVCADSAHRIHIERRRMVGGSTSQDP